MMLGWRNLVLATATAHLHTERVDRAPLGRFQSASQLTASRRISWRSQAIAEGGLSERACRRALEIANDADPRIPAPKAKFGPDATLDPSEIVEIESTLLREVFNV